MFVFKHDISKKKMKESHVNAEKRIMKYVSSIAEFGIWLSRDTNTNFIGYANANWA